MMKDTKERARYVIINIILFLIILTLAIYIYLIIQKNKESIIEGYEYSINIIESTLKAEKTNTDNYTASKEYLVIPNDDISLSKEEYNFQQIANNKYYYNQLNDDAKLIYDSIENNLNNMKSGTYQIKLPKELANVLKYEGGATMLDQNFQSAWDALSLDRTDIFFIDVSKINLNIKKITYGSNTSYSLSIVPQDENGYLIDGLTDEKDVNSILNKIKANRDSIINNIQGDTYNKILEAHDWIIENLEYSSDVQNANAYNLYGAFIEKSAVCEGYAEALKYVLDELEIPCILVSGTATNSNGITENHEWNYVELNEKWYAVDATWDDPILKGYGYITNSTKHKYFLQGSKTMDGNHTTLGKITETGQEFVYPVLEKNEYKK